MPNDSDQAVYDALIQDDTYWTKNPGGEPGVQADVIKFLKMIDAATVLDAGCGRGDLSLEMSRRGLKVAACDLCNARAFLQLKSARTIKPIFYHQCNLADMPFDDDAFDAVVCVDVMEHVFPEDMDAVFSEIMRVAPRAYMRIACYPSHHGEFRDLHRTVEPTHWWQGKAWDHGTVLTERQETRLTPKGKEFTSLTMTMRRGFL